MFFWGLYDLRIKKNFFNEFFPKLVTSKFTNFAACSFLINIFLNEGIFSNTLDV